MPNAEKMTIEMPITGFVYDAKTDSTKIILGGQFFVVYSGKWDEDRVRESLFKAQKEENRKRRCESVQKNSLFDKTVKGLNCCDGAAVQLGHCPEGCPYLASAERADKCIERLHEDALKLLENLNARVMPVEEAAKNAYSFYHAPDSVKPVFVQFRDETYSDEGLTPPWRGGVNQRALLKQPNRYGKDFVFWTDRPSPEQMKGVEWDA